MSQEVQEAMTAEEQTLTKPSALIAWHLRNSASVVRII
jgi:hypothetical protein